VIAPVEGAPGTQLRSTAGGEAVRLRLEGRLDIREATRLRALLSSDPAPKRVEIDMEALRAADGDAVLLLETALSRLGGRGTRVTLHRVPVRLHVLLHHHPILRFARDVDDLFTDPDLDWPGFRHSAR
jgi:ABC-type transporter Mla MlaB component